MHHVRTAVLLLALLLFSEVSFAEDPHASAAGDAAAAVTCAGDLAVLLAGVPDSVMPLPEDEPQMPAPYVSPSPGQITSSLGPQRLSNGDMLNYVPLPRDRERWWPELGDSPRPLGWRELAERMGYAAPQYVTPFNGSAGRTYGVYDLVLRYPTGYYWCYAY